MITLPAWLVWLGTLMLVYPTTAAEVELATIGTFAPGVPPAVIWTARLHLEAGRESGPVTLRLVLDPAIWGDGTTTQFIPGVTEAYVRRQSAQAEVSAGVERLPLEVGRLTIPFSVEPVDALGLHAGVPGIRVALYPDNATRLRLAAFEQDGLVRSLVSLRRQFATFEVEGHAVMLGRRTAIGLGGSGLVRSLVLYGEVWVLSAPAEWRYAVGVSGSIPNGLWTLEGGYAAPLPGQVPRHQLAAELTRQASPEIAWSISARAFFDADGVRGQAGIELVRSFASGDLTLTLAGQFGPGAPQAIVGAAIRLSL